MKELFPPRITVAPIKMHSDKPFLAAWHLQSSAPCLHISQASHMYGTVTDVVKNDSQAFTKLIKNKSLENALIMNINAVSKELYLG